MHAVLQRQQQAAQLVGVRWQLKRHRGRGTLQIVGHVQQLLRSVLGGSKFLKGDDVGMSSVSSSSCTVFLGARGFSRLTECGGVKHVQQLMHGVLGGSRAF
eukprot:363564-Chlamydomonas_euryale.AAC.2